LSKKAIIEIDFAKYKSVKLSRDDAIRLLESLQELLGKKTNDIEETLRYIRNFDEFYDYMRKKFKDYLAPPHRADDYIKGNAIIDKIKLLKENNEKYVVIIFDRRVKEDTISKALSHIGYEVEIKKTF